MKSSLTILALAIMQSTGLSECSQPAVLPTNTVNRIANAIFRAEGGSKTKHPYGILAVKATNPRLVCINTIQHAWKDFEGERQTVKSLDKTPVMFNGAPSLPFIQFLGNRYCPLSVDSVGYRNWTNNVWKIINK